MLLTTMSPPHKGSASVTVLYSTAPRTLPTHWLATAPPAISSTQVVRAVVFSIVAPRLPAPASTRTAQHVSVRITTLSITLLDNVLPTAPTAPIAPIAPTAPPLAVAHTRLQSHSEFPFLWVF
jgi:hypothetical protein